jgi:hypothetical protein
MSETLFYNPQTTITTDTIATGNISVNLDLLDQWLYLRPSVSNAAAIVAGMSRFANTYGLNAFGTNVFATAGLSNASVFGSTTSTAMYGTTYMPGGYVFQVDGNSGGTCAVVSSKENTVTNYAVSGTGSNGTWAGCLLPDGRAIIAPIVASVGKFTIWNNITRTSSAILISASQNSGMVNPSLCLTADGNVAINRPSNLMVLNTTTFALSNNATITGSYSICSCLDVTGNVILAPLNATPGIGVWNPTAGTVYNVTATGVSNDYKRVCGMTGDGRIVFESGTQTFVTVYNPFTLSYSSYTVPWAGGSVRFRSSRSLPDGRVMFIPGSGGTFFAMFNHVTNTVTTFVPNNLTNYLGTPSFVPDGRLIFPNTSGSSNVPVMTCLSRGVPEAWCLHPFFNKGN